MTGCGSKHTGDVAVVKELFTLNGHKNIDLFDMKYTDWNQNGRLSRLILIGIEIKRLPESIGKLSSLRVLSLTNNNLDILPQSFCNLKNLEKLYIDSNPIIHLPSRIGDLKKLILFDLRKTHIQILPDSFKDLTSLSKFWFYSDILTSIPPVICRTQNLKELIIRSYDETHEFIIPAEIGELVNLEWLSISAFFKRIPPSIKKLKNLKVLRLMFSYNPFITQDIYELDQLITLSLNGNDLVSLPEGIGKLTHLKELFLEDNNLTSLPRDLFTMKNWEVKNEKDKSILNIEYNRLCNVTPEQDAFLSKYSTNGKNWRYVQHCNDE